MAEACKTSSESQTRLLVVISGSNVFHETLEKMSERTEDGVERGRSNGEALTLPPVGGRKFLLARAIMPRPCCDVAIAPAGTVIAVSAVGLDS